MRNAFIVALLIFIFVLGKALVRVENERYALWLGMCPSLDQTLKSVSAGHNDAMTCMKRVQTRTGWWWHLYYAIAKES